MSLAPIVHVGKSSYISNVAWVARVEDAKFLWAEFPDFWEAYCSLTSRGIAYVAALVDEELVYFR